MTQERTIQQLTTSIGAEVSGLDLRSLSEAQRQQVQEDLDRHGVLVFRGQHLDLQAQKAFAETFGPLEPLQSLKFLGTDAAVVIDNILTSRNEQAEPKRWAEFAGWHTDSSFTRQIPRAAVLRAEVIPPYGGMTAWTNVCAAFEALSPTMQNWLMTLRAIHSYPDGYREAIGLFDKDRATQDRFNAEFGPRAQPVVFKHPRSGRFGLFVNPGYTTRIEGLSAAESRNLLSFLFNHLSNSDFIYRHRWVEGDIVAWDELGTLHLAPDPADYAPHPRRVVRVTAGLETPTPAWDDLPVSPSVIPAQPAPPVKGVIVSAQ